MQKEDVLNVWSNQTLVGKLWQETSGKMGFQYEKAWTKEGFAISQRLPLTDTIFPAYEAKAHNFFANLLPEANARMHVVRDLKIADTDFALLKAIGGECAGAISILPMGYTPATTSSYIPLPPETFKKILLKKGNIASFVQSQNRPRLSLAGAQDKCPIFVESDHYFLPENDAPSTHIIKFEMHDYRHIPAYECFLTMLAKNIGLPTVDCKLKIFDKIYFLLIKRYDRKKKNGKTIQRIHQEDFCQALGFNHAKKHEQDGGPSFKDCYQLVQQTSTQPIIDLKNLLKWQMFNLFAGNSDGHSKNLAFLYHTNQDITLAPFYDLVCTRAARIDTNLALSVGGEFDPGKITQTHWERLAKDCNIRLPFLKKTLKETIGNILDNLSLTKTQFENDYGEYPALLRCEQVITKTCRQQLKRSV